MIDALTMKLSLCHCCRAKQLQKQLLLVVIYSVVVFPLSSLFIKLLNGNQATYMHICMSFENETAFLFFNFTTVKNRDSR